MIEVKKCPICGKNVTEEHTFCSHHCYHLSKIGKKQSQETINKRVNKIKGQRRAWEIRICACGCGETFEIKKGTPKKYIKGHNYKDKTLQEKANIGRKKDRENNPEKYILAAQKSSEKLKGRIKSTEHQKKLIESHGTRGKTFEEIHGEERAKELKIQYAEINRTKIISEETRKKVSDFHKGRPKPKSKEFIENIKLTNSTPEFREKARLRSIELWKDPIYAEKCSRKISPNNAEIWLT